jgi:uncharacterized protein
MEYRRLGRTGLDVSAISLGTEYLINLPREHVVAVIREALKQGINYFDLFFAQPQFRDNMGAAFAGHREQAILAAHLGSTDVNGQYEKTRDLQVSERFFHDFLTRYHTDYVDILYLHNSDEQEDYDKVMRSDGLLGMAQRLQREGKARFIGFSSHTVAVALQAIASGLVDVLMFPINLASNAVPGKRELFSACVAHNVGLVAMKPFAGGKLLQQGQTVDMEFWQTGGAPAQLQKSVPITPVQCLAYVLSQVGVSTIVPGCKDLEQLAAALAYWQATEEQKDFAAVVSGFQQYVTGECVYCNHCLPCPSTIDIGQTIRLLETAQRHLTDAVRAAYAALPSKASDCVQCGSCEERCPFGVDVISKMEQAGALLG